MKPTLIDTDTLSELLKLKNPTVQKRAKAFIATVGPKAFSAITRHEVIRGLKLVGNHSFLQRFEHFSTTCLILPVDQGVLDTATDLWVFDRKKGFPCNDADLWIGATAIIHGRVLATGNTRHFDWMPKIELENWRQETIA